MGKEQTRVTIKTGTEKIENILQGLPCPTVDCDGKMQILISFNKEGESLTTFSCYSCGATPDLNSIKITLNISPPKRPPKSNSKS